MSSILKLLGDDPKLNLLLALTLPFVIAFVVAAACEGFYALWHWWTRHHHHHSHHLR